MDYKVRLIIFSIFLFLLGCKNKTDNIDKNWNLWISVTNSLTSETSRVKIYGGLDTINFSKIVMVKTDSIEKEYLGITSIGKPKIELNTAISKAVKREILNQVLFIFKKYDFFVPIDTMKNGDDIDISLSFNSKHMRCIFYDTKRDKLQSDVDILLKKINNVLKDREKL